MLAYTFKFGKNEDDSKLTLLYIKYKNLMLKAAYFYLHDYVLSEDCVHSAFLDIARNISNVGDVDDPQTKSYILTIVRARAINMFKHECRERNLYDYENDGTDVAGECLEDDFFENMDKQLLARRIVELPIELREALILRYAYDFSYIRIAENLKITPAAARKRVQRAKEYLRATIDD